MILQFGDVTFDDGTRQVHRGETAVHISPKAFDLLAALLRERPRAVSKGELHAILWPETFVADANLAVLVAEIRDALGDDSKASRFVRTVHRFGYAFHGDVVELPARHPSAAPASSTYWLVAEFRQIPLLPGDNLVGRDPGGQVWLDAPGVSRQHARITVNGDRVILTDLRSKNGTRVRGELVTADVVLADGDEIWFGACAVTLRIYSANAVTVSEADPVRHT
jgi:DNA-binding winged helix-turn-helix (wHTH) protein